MAMRGAEAHQARGLADPLNHPAFSAPDLADRLPLLSVDLLTPPFFRRRLLSGCGRRRIPEVPALHHHRPQAARHLVGKSNGHQHPWFPGQHPAKPAALRCAPAAGMLYNGHRTADQQTADITLPHLRCGPKPRLSASGVLAGHKAKPGSEVSGATEDCHWRCEGLDRHGRDWPEHRCMP